MSDAMPIELRETRLEIQLTDEAEKRIQIDDIEIGENDNRWLRVLASFTQDKKLHFVIATPWVPDKGDPEGEEEHWFLPVTVTEKDVYASRFAKSKYVPD